MQFYSKNLLCNINLRIESRTFIKISEFSKNCASFPKVILKNYMPNFVILMLEHLIDCVY